MEHHGVAVMASTYGVKEHTFTTQWSQFFLEEKKNQMASVFFYIILHSFYIS